MRSTEIQMNQYATDNSEHTLFIRYLGQSLETLKLLVLPEDSSQPESDRISMKMDAAFCAAKALFWIVAATVLSLGIAHLN